MNTGPRTIILVAALAALAAAAPALRADGFIIPDRRPGGEPVPPLSVKYHRVKVEIVDQVARTSIDQVFVNHFDRDIEGTYIFPVPEGASVTDFAMFIGGERVKGEILDSGRARGIYEDIVRRLRDPGLLEYAGRNLFRARVYPIPGRGEKRVQISYTEVLKADNGLVRYLYPLSTERFSRDPLGDVGIGVRIESQVPVVNVYSPSHRISVRKEGPGDVRAGYEDRDVRPDKDFVLFYSMSKDTVGLSFLSWPEGEGQGYFMLLAGPRFSAPGERIAAKDVVLVLDSSGSMEGAKIRQAKAAARFILGHLDRRDAFTLIDFDDGVTAFSDGLVPATADNVERAQKFVEAIEDSGGTNINDALTGALARMRGGDRPGYVLFLTDGLPTVGTTDTRDILRNLREADRRRSRIFVFGVGDDVNTELLDRIAADHRGASVYVGLHEDLEVALSSFYEKIASPVLSDLAVEFSGIEASQVYPRTLPDLFRGSELVLVGRYRGDGPAGAVLTGRIGGETRRFVLDRRALGGGRTSFLPRLWATRRIGYLLEEVRLQGRNAELEDEIRRLGLKYGIVTPYTSFLVTERERMTIDAAAPAAQEALATGQVAGVGAVKAAKATQAFKLEDRAAEADSERIVYKDDRTFYLKGEVWTDSEYRDGLPVTEIKFNTDEYFGLLAAKPGLAKYLSVSAKLIVVFEGVAYRITE